MNIKFNPWEEKYKYPFGAVKDNTKVTFSLEIQNENINQVQICLLEKFSQKKIILNLKKQGNSREYKITTIVSTGLYFYYFKIKYDDSYQKKIIYFGKNGAVCEEKLLDKYQLTVFEKNVSKVKWYQHSICYQIFPDSFFTAKDTCLTNGLKKDILIYGDKNDSPIYVKNKDGDIIRWTFYGGNLRGIIQKIPYLKSLGIDCIYLNPIFESSSTHRYDTNDYFKIDKLLGNENDFDELIQKCHENKIHIILDGVFDHVGSDSRYFNKSGIYGKNHGAFQNIQSRYYSWFTFNNYPNDYQCWWGVRDMPQIKKNNQDFHTFIAGKNGVINYWTKKGVDGWRIDVADELTDTFINKIRQRLDYFSNKILIGEVWEDASNKVSYNHQRKYVFGDELDGSMNYPLRDGLINILINHKVNETALNWMQLYENYPFDYLLNCLNNIGTHDTERILTVLDNNLSKLEIAIGFLFMFPGVPCIYYGDEVGLKGGRDPDNRAYYPWKRENWKVFEIYKKWINRRKKSKVMQEGKMTIFVCDTVIGIIRFKEEERPIIYFANCSPSSVMLKSNKIKIYHKSTKFKKYLIEHCDNFKLKGFGSKYLVI